MKISSQKGTIFDIHKNIDVVKLMKNYKFLFLICLITGLFAQAQDSIKVLDFEDVKKANQKVDEYGHTYIYDDNLKAKIYEINGEKVVVMDELAILPKPKFNNQLDRNYYYFLNKKLNRVYPLFLTALQQYRDIQHEMSLLGDDTAKKKLAKQKQDELASQYETQLRDLTTSEGQVFAKLMSRATGKTVYDIIKELRGGWSAFWWNVKGNVADIELKKPYDPYKNRDDEFVENLLLSNWRLGYFKPYQGFENFKIARP